MMETREDAKTVLKRKK